MTEQPPNPLRFNLAWLVVYVALMALVIAGVIYGRNRAMEIYGSTTAQAEWDAWRDDAKRMAEQPSPVKRRVPGSAEPPALVLMRDYFAVCLIGALLLSTVLFGTFMVFIRGALSQRTHIQGKPHRVV
jgi:hypothetical protein